jgi:hypothetical protein
VRVKWESLGPVQTTAVKTAQIKSAHDRALLCAGALLGLFLLLPAQARATERWETLQAIHWVENPDNRETPGPCGELGAYQFRADTWHRYSSRPFSQALDRRASDEVAVRYYESIKANLVRNGVAPTTYNIAMAWNAGIAGVVRDSAPACSRDYASRVNNLVSELHARMASNP